MLDLWKKGANVVVVLVSNAVGCGIGFSVTIQAIYRLACKNTTR